MEKLSKGQPADYAAMIGALVVLVAFFVLPFLQTETESLTGFGLYQQDGHLFTLLIVVFALIALLGALGRIWEPRERAGLKSTAVWLSGLLCLIMVFSTNPEQSGIGFVAALLGSAVLLLQSLFYSIPDPNAEALAAHARQMAEQRAERAASPLSLAWHQHTVDRDNLAIQQFESLLKENPDNLDALYGLAVALKNSDRQQEAQDLLAQLAEKVNLLDPQSEDEVNRKSMLTRMVSQQLQRIKEAG